MSGPDPDRLLESAPPGTRHPRLHVLGRDGLDVPAAERAVADLLAALGKDPGSARLAETPRRVAHAVVPVNDGHGDPDRG